VTVYFVLGEQLQATQRYIPRTLGVGAAALNELLWGPPPLNLAGFETAIPTPEDVLNYHARGADWGPRVTLRGLTITDGVATADFSREMQSYAGGSLRVMLIRQQIEQTLRQFPTVQEVRIAVEGETEGVLEP
jgi:spore germination protein GerM